MTWRIMTRCAARALVLLGLAAVPAAAGGLPEDDAETASSGRLQIVDFNADGEKRITVSHSQVSLVEIARDHVNRVITPFERPEVWTSSSAEIQTSRGVLYVQPADDAPVSLFITEEGRQEFAVNITLVPRSVPPVELYIDLDAKVARVLEAAYAQEAAMRAQTSRAPVTPVAAGAGRREPWFDAVKSVLTAMAVGDVPRGYSESAPRRAPVCATGLGFEASFERSQWYRSRQFEVVIGRVINHGPAGIFKEFWCAEAGVAAVALWPSADIPAGGQAELLILRHVDGGPGGAAPVRMRPSLIGG